MNSNKIQELLYSEKPSDHRAGIKAITDCPNHRFLDRLWWIHCTMQEDPEVYSETKERWFILYKESYDALKRCVVLDKQWLRTTILKADKNTPCLHDLAYLLASLKDGKEIWEETKNHLFALLHGKKMRAFITNVLVFKDISQKEWLKTQLDNSKDMVSTKAFQALWRMDADAAIEAFDVIDKKELLLSRHWNIAPLLKIRPAEIQKKISAWWDECHDLPAKWSMFQENEIYVAPQCQRQMMAHLEELLKETTESKNDHYHSFMFVLLSKMDTLEQLQIFRSYQGSNLEKLLVQFIREKIIAEIVIPQLGIKGYGLYEPMMVLQKIGGSGYIEIINAWLQAKNPYFCEEGGIRSAMKAADNKTFDLLEEIIQQKDCWPMSDNFPLKQIHAGRVLASWRKYEAVYTSLMTWGLETSMDINYWKMKENIVSEEIAERCLAAIENGEKTVGNIVSLGQFSPPSTSRYYQPVIEILKDTENEDLVIACLITVELLNTNTIEVIREVGKYLKSPKIGFFALRALVRMNTEDSKKYLVEHLHDIGDDRAFSLACDLFPDEKACEYLIEVFSSEKMQSQELLHKFYHINHLVNLINNTSEDQHDLLKAKGLLNQENAIELCKAYVGKNQKDFWNGVGKPDIIRALGCFDKEEAFHAAINCLKDVDNFDRACFPALIMDYALDKDAVVQVFLDIAKEEKSLDILWAMGRAIASSEREGLAIEALNSESYETRIAACHLCSRLSPKTEVMDKLRWMIEYDDDTDVAYAADQALRLLQESLETERLVEALKKEQDREMQWMYLDAILQLGDAGYKDAPVPKWAIEVEEILKGSFFVHKYFVDEWQNSQKKLKERAKKMEKK